MGRKKVEGPAVTITENRSPVKKRNGKTKKDDDSLPDPLPNDAKQGPAVTRQSKRAPPLAFTENRSPVKKRKGKTKKDDALPDPLPNDAKQDSDRKLVMKKGSTPVDGLCPVASSAHVFSKDGNIWDCMLNQTNIQFNNNKYYLIQLLEDDTKDTYNVWMRWGRVGQNGQNSLQPCGSDLEKAKNIFTKKFSDKTKNLWEDRYNFQKVPGKYDLLKMDYCEDTTDSTPPDAKVASVEPKKVESKLDEPVRILVELIFDLKAMEEAVVEMKYDAKKAPLGKLTVEQVTAGYDALRIVDAVIMSGNVDNRKLLDACNKFYTRIPHNFGMKVPPLIRTSAEVQEKLLLLQVLGDIQAAVSILSEPLNATTHPADQRYKGLHCDLCVLQPESDTFQVLEKYLLSTHGITHSHYKIKLERIFECCKQSEGARFQDVGNRMLLWHGSRITNLAGILSQGLRIAPPEAPSTGYMFGKGIYFADTSSKSANYCMPSMRNKTGLLLLCEVALGKSSELLNACYTANKLPKGCHSVKGLGRISPDPKTAHHLPDGTLVPCGPGIETDVKNSKGYTLQYNEYVVYNPDQVKLRYVLKVQFIFS